MTIGWQEQLRPGVALREIVRQATAALIQMDSERLEELARCCSDLNRELQNTDPESAIEAAAAMCDSAQDLRLLERVLFETRANLTVFTRLHAMRVSEVRRLQSGEQARERRVSYGDN